MGSRQKPKVTSSVWAQSFKTPLQPKDAILEKAAKCFVDSDDSSLFAA